jgi:hypothetical protein
MAEKKDKNAAKVAELRRLNGNNQCFDCSEKVREGPAGPVRQRACAAVHGVSFSGAHVDL